ncbi:MAG: hypothetical protein ACREDL_12740, partial [Bradyrhizobium sp.]
ARREELSSGYAEHEKEARLEGTPQLGAGPVFPLELLPTITKSFDPGTAIPGYARWIVGIDFGFGHPFAAVLIAWQHDLGQVWVIDSFRMDRSSALYHVQRIHSMTRGLRIPVAWPHDGNQRDKGSGLPLAKQYEGFGAKMLPSHAVNHGTKTNAIEPALEEMRQLMFEGKLTIASQNTELLEEMRAYHRDQDFRVVKHRDDLISALRYAIMMRRQGKMLADCEGIGFGNMQFAGQRSRLRSEPRTAEGSDFDLFTGQ